MNKLSNIKTIITTWWFVQGIAFTAIFIWNVCAQNDTQAWALTFGIILLLAATLRQKGDLLRRIADMVLLAYAVSFAIIAAILASLNSFKPWFVTLLTAVAVVNIAASIISLRRKAKKE